MGLTVRVRDGTEGATPKLLDEPKEELEAKEAKTLGVLGGTCDEIEDEDDTPELVAEEEEPAPDCCNEEA